MRLCIIPARGGSKRIPRKNIKLFSGKPIIAYSIEAAIKSGCFDQVIVSTDDDEIADVAKSYGAGVPFLRPDDLANDYAGTIPVIKQAVEWYESQGIQLSEVCCIYATAPFIQVKYIQQAYQNLLSTGADYCFPVCHFPSPIQRAFKLNEQARVEMFHPENFNARSQDLEEAYFDAGQFYWGKPEAFKSEKPFFSPVSTFVMLPSYLVQDIDNMDDWKRAEVMYQVLQKNGELT